MEKNPIGFKPTGCEKMRYLAHKASGKSLPSENFIHIPTIDVYGNREPWEIFDELFDDEEAHFFSKLKIKQPRKKRARSVGAGAWKICPGEGLDIFDRTREKIGLMKRYVYRSPPLQAHQDKRWVLEEYTLLACRTKGFRFCTVRKNPDFLSYDVASEDDV